jgi:hypothetical protein
MNIQGFFELKDWSLGLDLTSSETTLDIRSLLKATNIELTPKRGLAKRKGVAKLFSEKIADASVTDVINYYSSNGNYILALCNGSLWRHTAQGWGAVREGLSQTKRLSFSILNDVCYIVNGYDDNFKVLNNNSYNIGITAPSSTPTVSKTTGTLSGNYAYVYTYYSSLFNIEGNPSPVSNIISPSNEGIKVEYLNNNDPQVDKIRIYRTYSLQPSEEPVNFYLVTEVANANSYYIDTISDNNLGAAVEFDNYIPPTAKFVVEYKNRLFYANCPDEEDGESLVVYSKINNGDAVPPLNYEYFGKGDGEEITGIASLPDYLVVFKKNKIFTIAGDFELKRLEISDYRVGCISPYSIVKVGKQVVFLSENGWYSFDGETLYPVSKTIADKLIADGYISPYNHNGITGVLYPIKNQIRYLITASGLETREYVATFILPTINYFEPIPATAIASTTSYMYLAGYFAWTVNIYPNHNFKCLGKYIDEEGETRIIAGGDNGYVYLLDNGNTDENYPIPIEIESGWFNFRKPENMCFLLRYFRCNYYTGGKDNISLSFMVDFNPKKYNYYLKGTEAVYCGEPNTYCNLVYCGGGANLIDEKGTDAGLTGRLFKYIITGDLSNEFILNSLTLYYRGKGIREYGE